MTERGIRQRWAALAVGAFVVLMAFEVWTEDEPVGIGDFLADALQTALIVVAATGVSLLTGRYQKEQEEKASLVRDLELARAEGQAWRENAQGYLSGLGEEIEKQFEKWQLTAAEREVGLLMLKGFSHRELARLRGTTEATVRHQAQAIYQKSTLPGRSAFCAYFLEDLLPSRGHDTTELPRPKSE
jgi:DNA-binding CsgD family transcriptional regulator